MRLWPSAMLLCGASLYGQQVMPVGIVRGSLLSWQGSVAFGNLTVQRTDGAVYGCSYDAHTLFQRNQWPIQVDDLNAGEPVEVLSDRKSRACYARMLWVTYQQPEPEGWRPRPAPRVLPGFQPRGNLMFGGLVVDSTPRSITLRTRTGERTLLLRADTRYSGDGVRLKTPEPLLNKHVFVRAGRNIYGQLEAYQVAWGEILTVP